MPPITLRVAIRKSGDALLALINDILAGRLEIESAPFDITQCVEEAVDLVSAHAADKGLELACSIDPQAHLMIIGDLARARQVLVNLLTNAIKFTAQGIVLVEVTRNLTPADGQIEIIFSINDTGIGIPADRRDQLFKSFSQVDSSTTRLYGGTGLGLAICKQLVELMGGRIWLESEVGQGSTFHFTIVGAKNEAPPVVVEKRPSLVGKHILAVDDLEINQKILARHLESQGMIVQTVTTGAEALTLLERGDRFDGAILDMQMPEMDGIMLADKIKMLPDGALLPLVMLTALGRHQIKNSNVAGVLTKPVKTSQLFDLLSRVLGGAAETRTGARPVLDQQFARQFPLRILLAEDNVINQEVVLRILDKMGYRADLAANGKEAFEAVQRQSYDVVLMDVQMPEMDGIEATTRITTHLGAQRPWIIALTANALQGDRERYLGVGMDDYVSKPIRVDELARALSQSRPRHQQGLSTIGKSS